MSKNADFHADFEFVEKVVKNAQVINKTSLTNMIKSEKNAYFRHVFANNFFCAFFQTFFNGFEIIMKFCVFDTHIEFLRKKKYFCSY